MNEVRRETVLARYQNYFRGDDDAIAHCLIRTDGEMIRLMQGLEPVTVHVESIHDELYDQLTRLLADELPAAQWPKASYDNSGFNFIVDVNGPSGSEIAVFGKKAGDIAQYYAAPADSGVGTLIRKIANIDPAAPANLIDGNTT